MSVILIHAKQVITGGAVIVNIFIEAFVDVLPRKSILLHSADDCFVPFEIEVLVVDIRFFSFPTISRH